MKLHIFASGLLLAVSFTACSGEKKETTEKEGVETVLPSLPNEVTVMPLKKQVFNHELISNGKVTAQDYADLYFRTVFLCSFRSNHSCRQTGNIMAR